MQPIDIESIIKKYSKGYDNSVKIEGERVKNNQNQMIDKLAYDVGSIREYNGAFAQINNKNQPHHQLFNSYSHGLNQGPQSWSMNDAMKSSYLPLKEENSAQKSMNLLNNESKYPLKTQQWDNKNSYQAKDYSLLNTTNQNENTYSYGSPEYNKNYGLELKFSNQLLRMQPLKNQEEGIFVASVQRGDEIKNSFQLPQSNYNNLFKGSVYLSQKKTQPYPHNNYNLNKNKHLEGQHKASHNNKTYLQELHEQKPLIQTNDLPHYEYESRLRIIGDKQLLGDYQKKTNYFSDISTGIKNQPIQTCTQNQYNYHTYSQYAPNQNTYQQMRFNEIGKTISLAQNTKNHQQLETGQSYYQKTQPPSNTLKSTTTNTPNKQGFIPLHKTKQQIQNDLYDLKLYQLKNKQVYDQLKITPNTIKNTQLKQFQNNSLCGWKLNQKSVIYEINTHDDKKNKQLFGKWC